MATHLSSYLLLISDDIVYDFDLMLQRKREENYRRRKRKNIDIINDNDDVIAEMIQQMKQAADVRPGLHSIDFTYDLFEFRTTSN